MTEENKNEGVNEGVNEGAKNECFCRSKWFRKFLTTALGTFVGVFCALSLFAALHKPPMPHCPFAKGPMMRPPMHCQHHYGHHRMPRGDFHRKMEKRDFQRPDKADFTQKQSVKQ